MPRERLYLIDIVKAAHAIDRFLAGIERDAFLASELLQSAVLHQLTVIGEAASRLPEDLRSRHGQVPWRSIAAFRNIAVHAYFSVDYELVWIAATSDTPLLREQVECVLASLPDADPPRPTS